MFMLSGVGDLLLGYSSPSLFLTPMGVLLAGALIATLALGVHFTINAILDRAPELSSEWWLTPIVSVAYPIPFIALLVARKLFLTSGNFDRYSILGCSAGISLCAALVAILIGADFKEVATGVTIGALNLAASLVLIVQTWYHHTVLPLGVKVRHTAAHAALFVAWGGFAGWVYGWKGIYVVCAACYCVVAVAVIVVSCLRILPRTHDLTSRYAFLSPSPGMAGAFKVEFATEKIKMGDMTIWSGLYAVVAFCIFGLFLTAFEPLIISGVFVSCASIATMGLYQWMMATSSYTLLEQVRPHITKGTMQLAFSRIAHDLRYSSQYERKDASDVFYSLKQLSNSILIASQVRDRYAGGQDLKNAFTEWAVIPLVKANIDESLFERAAKNKSIYRRVLNIMDEELHSLRSRRGRLMCYLQRAIFASVRYSEIECQARAGRFAAALAGEPSLVDTMLRGMDAYGTTAPDREGGNFYRDLITALDYALKNGRVLRFVDGDVGRVNKMPVEAEALGVLLRAFDLSFPDVFAPFNATSAWGAFSHRVVGECSVGGAKTKAQATCENDTFCDPDFPAELSSITDIRDEELSDSILGHLRWLRPQETAEGCVLWNRRPRPSDIVPGLLSKVFLEAVHAVCTSCPSLITRMFQGDVASDAICDRYTVRFCVGLGRSTDVTVDTRFPCYPDTNQPIFATYSRSSCVWPMVLEKAFAKLRGSYSDLENSNLASVISFLVGGLPERVNLDRVVKSKPYVIFNQVKQWIQSGCVVAAKTPAGPPLPGGLKADRCYSLVDIKELPEGPLVKLKGGGGPDVSGVSEWSLAAAPRLLVYNGSGCTMGCGCSGLRF